MVLDADSAYLALKARDARFDGRFFVGVTSTGVYCRPVCRVRTPRRENCRFFPSAAQAEAARFRPCLKCRPEVAPGLSFADSSRSLAASAAALIDQAVREGRPLTLPALAARLGVTDRHLRRIFQAEHGVAPLAYLTTQRLLLAKQLLTDTAQPVTQVALASGFASLRRFNAAFVERYRLQPTRLRREGASPGDGLRLAYRPPFDAASLLGFFAARALPGVEQVEAFALRRTLALTHQGRPLAGWIECRLVPERCELRLEVAPTLAPALGAVMRRVRQAFDLDAEPAVIDRALAALPGAPGTRLPGAFDGFESAVRVVLGQQVTVKAARTLAGRLVERFGMRIETPFDGLARLFPPAPVLAQASAEAIGTLGIVRQRVAAIRALAAAVASGAIELHPGAPLEATLDALRALPGIGEWTAQVIALRALGWPDAFPATDIGVYQALDTRDPRRSAERAQAWRPWRGYALMRLWSGLEAAQTTKAISP